MTHPERLLDLLADEATVGLADAERAELDSLLTSARLHELGGASRAERDALALAAAALDLALAAGQLGIEPMPAHLHERLTDTGRGWAAGRDGHASAGLPGANGAAPLRLASAPPRGSGSGTDTAPSPSARASRLAWAGWLVAAAAIVLAVLAWMPTAAPSTPGAGSPVPPVVARTRLLETPGVVRASWQPVQTEWIRGEEAGDVVWNQARQEGYMRFTGLKPNDHDERVYQLWIFQDSPDAEATPVQGGVFDVPAGASEVVLPITPGIHLAKRPVAFAITVERPGGVWVSDRQRLPVLAVVPPEDACEPTDG